jgi:hypothetical protein
MTVRDPTPDLRVRIAEGKSRDFEWAFNRLVEILAEDVQGRPDAEVLRGVLMRAFDRLHLENLERQAKLTRMANDAHA